MRGLWEEIQVGELEYTTSEVYEMLKREIFTYNHVFIPSEEGHWIKTIGENGITSAVRCSECGFEDNRYMLFRYCPDCGTKMVKPQESEVQDADSN